MEYDCLLLRYGELFLKSRYHARQFGQQLQQNLFRITGKPARRTRGRLIMDYFPEYQKVRQVFGLTSCSPAWQVDKELEKIKAKALAAAQAFSGTFKIETRRADKTFPLTSVQINTVIGKYIEQNTTLTADYQHPRHTLYLEINQEAAYLFTQTVPGAGGLPVGVSGPVHLLLEGEASILAGLLMMKRGCTVIPVSVGKERKGTKELNLFLLQQFSPTPLIARSFQDEQELTEFVQQQNTVLVTEEGLGKKRKSSSVVTLSPLVAYTEEEIQSRLHAFKKLASGL